MSYLNDDEREPLIDALRANRNSDRPRGRLLPARETGRHLRLVATVESIVRAREAAAWERGHDAGVADGQASEGTPCRANPYDTGDTDE